MRGSLAARLESKTHTVPFTSCWIFAGTEKRNGYGQIRSGGKMISAHRAAYAVEHGEIPDGLHVLHRCDNPACVNPDHLFLGTHNDNMADMKAKGRRVASIVGTKVGSAKLSEDDVKEIRRAYSANEATQQKLAARFGVSQPLIGKIVRRVWWAHV